jgi:hypothetical protein
MQHAILIMIVLRTGRVKLDQFLDIMEVNLCRGSTKHCFTCLHEKQAFESKKKLPFVWPLTEHIFVSEHSFFFLELTFHCENIFAGT